LNKTNALFANIKFGAVAILTSVALAACGGGGGSSGSSETNNSSSNTNTNTNTPTTSTQAVTLLTPAATQAALPSATGNAAGDGLSFLNTIRSNAGLAQFTTNAGLVTAATDHATYLVANTASGHYETQGLTGFTGYDPLTRIEAEGSYTAIGETVVAGSNLAFTDSLTGVSLLFDAPYHRLVMLGDFKSVGIGAVANASWEAVNLDYGNVAGQISDTQLVVYPYPGQTNVPVSWLANESPNPFASQPSYELQTVGYPSVALGNLGAKLSSIVFTLTDASGNNVPCLAQTPDNDSTDLSNGAMCVPYAPLTPNTRYTEHIAGVSTAGGQLHPINLTWSWTTGAATASAMAQAQGAQTSRPLPKFDEKPLSVVK
jgi:uncharacterized protein YkwD